jgi:tRNA A-37 threonylcarbamoyl transferase component Bud32
VNADEVEYRPGRLVRGWARLSQVLSRYLWIWPLVGAVFLSAVGLWVRYQVESSTKAELGSRLHTLLNADVAALRLWFSERESDARALVADSRIQGAIVNLAEMVRDADIGPVALYNSEASRTLQSVLKPMVESEHYVDYVVLSPGRRILAATRRGMVGRIAPQAYEGFFQKAMQGKVTVSQPFARELTASQRGEGPTMFVATPVRATNGDVVAVLGLRMKPEEEFSQIFSVARMGRSGEAYAFDRRGVMLTASRFDPQLKKLGLIPDTPDATPILNLRLIDPGVDLERSPQAEQVVARITSLTRTNLFNPRREIRQPRGGAEMPLTRMAAMATRGWDGVDVDGYRNYRGVRVVGAWAWLSEFGMGVSTEVEASEAFQTLYLLRQAFLVLFLLLAASAAIILAFTLMVERLKESVRTSNLVAMRLGQYVLMQEIARGSNGRVYRARHMLLRRPVAIKLLSPEHRDKTSVERFEREVQMTSQLTHPNTVAIYDYGRTPEGLFYYAMEYLEGINLDQLVRQFGAQDEARVIYILRQICGSLAEAHRIGLIHRDIKPANIVLTRRGGACDVVKVLDFGLVEAVNAPQSGGKRMTAGTPHFMSPEAAAHPEKVEARSDVYGVGAVGYWLLTGKTLFNTEDIDALLERQASEMPEAPSSRGGRELSGDLESLIMQCLSKRIEDRPGGAEVLEESLARCRSVGGWTLATAELWWRHNVVASKEQPYTPMPEKTLVMAPRKTEPA